MFVKETQFQGSISQWACTMVLYSNYSPIPKLLSLAAQKFGVYLSSPLSFLFVFVSSKSSCGSDLEGFGDSEAGTLSVEFSTDGTVGDCRFFLFAVHALTP